MMSKTSPTTLNSKIESDENCILKMFTPPVEVGVFITYLLLTFLTIKFVFRSQNFFRRCSVPACERLLSHLNGRCDSRINFPGYSEAFARRCRHLANVQTCRSFSHNLGLPQARCCHMWYTKEPNQSSDETFSRSNVSP